MTPPLLIDIHNHVGVDLQCYLAGSSPYAQELPALVAAGEGRSVTHWVVFPFVCHLGCGIPGLRAGRLEATGALEAVPYAFENERMLREIFSLYPEHAPRMLPFLMVDPLRNPAGQAGALRRLATQHRVHGLKVQPTMLQSPIKELLGGARGLLELSAELDLPWVIHSSIAPADRWSQAGDILDIAEAWPKVRFCLAHSCRFDRPSLDRLAALPNTWFDCSAHLIHCRCAVDDNLAVVAPRGRRFPTDYRDPVRVLADLDRAYPGKLLWGSDSPFYSYVAMHEGRLLELKSTYAAEIAALLALPAPVREAISRDNPLRFLKTSHERLLAQRS